MLGTWFITGVTVVYPEPIISIFDCSTTCIADGLLVENRPDNAEKVKVFPLDELLSTTGPSVTSPDKEMVM